MFIMCLYRIDWLFYDRKAKRMHDLHGGSCLGIFVAGDVGELHEEL